MTRVLVLGATGFVGGRLMEALKGEVGLNAIGCARRVTNSSDSYLAMDATDVDQLRLQIPKFDCIVNCVAGDGDSMIRASRALADAVRSAGVSPRIVHLSSMAVYGGAKGDITEETPLRSDGGWYSDAKIESEEIMRSLSLAGVDVVVMRPGCIYGPGSVQWTKRVAALLQAGRLGDLGVLGDGWSNLVYVDDVCAAIVRVVKFSGSVAGAFNLAATPPVRWNRYFINLAEAIGVSPVPRVSSKALTLDSKLLSPALKIGEILFRKFKFTPQWYPEIQPPSLVRLWRSEVSLNSDRAQSVLGLRWTSIDDGVTGSVKWLRARRSS